jgi:hypothetical protein
MVHGRVSAVRQRVAVLPSNNMAFHDTGMRVWLQTGFGLLIGFIENVQMVATVTDCSAIATSHSLSAVPYSTYGASSVCCLFSNVFCSGVHVRTGWHGTDRAENTIPLLLLAGCYLATAAAESPISRLSPINGPTCLTAFITLCFHFNLEFRKFSFPLRVLALPLNLNLHLNHLVVKSSCLSIKCIWSSFRGDDRVHGVEWLHDWWVMNREIAKGSGQGLIEVLSWHLP